MCWLLFWLVMMGVFFLFAWFLGEGRILLLNGIRGFEVGLKRDLGQGWFLGLGYIGSGLVFGWIGLRCNNNHKGPVWFMMKTRTIYVDSENSRG